MFRATHCTDVPYWLKWRQRALQNLMSSRLASFVHGCATPLLKVGFVANTQDYTSHSLGPNSLIEALDESDQPSELERTLTPRARVRESRRDLSEGSIVLVNENFGVKRKVLTVSPPPAPENTCHEPIHRLSAVDCELGLGFVKLQWILWI
jgi:hypothetical protein